MILRAFVPLWRISRLPAEALRSTRLGLPLRLIAVLSEALAGQLVSRGWHVVHAGRVYPAVVEVE
jgi:hypothetical protein